jgi:hypothetical protein
MSSLEDPGKALRISSHPERKPSQPNRLPRLSVTFPVIFSALQHENCPQSDHFQFRLSLLF